MGRRLRRLPHRPSRRVLRRSLVAFGVIVIVFCVATARLLVWPAVGAPADLSAIVMLAGPGNRLGVAQGLARQHRAPLLVVSQGVSVSGDPCPSPTPGVRLICFHPSPADTRGEAEYIGRLAKKYGWHSLVLVTTREQDTRARIIVGRCFTGSVYVITTSRPWYDWPDQIAYGWGALVKALLLKRTC
jgi:hypothetical protein